MGAFPLDVTACHIDALAADGHKWMLGPEGCAILYINQALQDRVEPVEFGWTNVAGYADYGSRDMALRQDAGRYECGTLNTIGCFGLRHQLNFYLKSGKEKSPPLSKTWATGSRPGSRPKDTNCSAAHARERRPASSASASPESRPPRSSGSSGEQNIIAAPRAGWVRTSPHFYISPAEIDRLIDALP